MILWKILLTIKSKYVPEVSKKMEKNRSKKCHQILKQKKIWEKKSSKNVLC